jgi:hypothetical protein
MRASCGRVAGVPGGVGVLRFVLGRVDADGSPSQQGIEVDHLEETALEEGLLDPSLPLPLPDIIAIAKCVSRSATASLRAPALKNERERMRIPLVERVKVGMGQQGVGVQALGGVRHKTRAYDLLEPITASDNDERTTTRVENGQSTWCVA